MPRVRKILPMTKRQRQLRRVRVRKIQALSRPQRPLNQLALAVDKSIYRFRQLAAARTATQSTTVVAAGDSFTFSQLSNVASFSSLYDKYRVDYLEYTFRPQYNQQYFSTQANFIVPQIYIAPDRDDANTPTGISYMQEYQSCQVHQTDTFTLRFKPGVQLGVFGGAGIITGGTVISPWLDCSQTGIPHFGIKYAIDAGIATALQTWNITLAVGLSFKNVH